MSYANLDYIEEHSDEIQNYVTVYENNYTYEIPAQDIETLSTKKDYIILKQYNKKGFITTDHKFLVKPNYDDIVSISMSTKTFVFAIIDNNNKRKMGLANFNEEIILQPMYNAIRYNNLDLFVVQKDY